MLSLLESGSESYLFSTVTYFIWWVGSADIQWKASDTEDTDRAKKFDSVRV